MGGVAVRERRNATVLPGPAKRPERQPARLPGNQALGSLLGTLTVQRQGCGGSCGCGGTCDDAPSKAPEADDLVAGAPVQRLATPPTHAPAPPAHLLPGLQGRAGNAAVAKLLARSPAPPVQRLDASDLLPDWISSAIFGTKDKAAASAAKTHSDAQDTERQADRSANDALKKVEAETPKLAAKTAETATKADQQLAKGNDTVAKGKSDLDKATTKAAAGVKESAAKTQEANKAEKLLEGQEPSCSISKVMKGAEKVADILGKPFGIKGAELLQKAGKLISEIGDNLKAGAKAIGKLMSDAKAAYNQADEWVKQKLGLDIATIGSWALTLSNPITASLALGKWAAGKVMDGALWAGKKLGQLAQYAAKEGPALIRSIKAKVGGWLDRLGPLGAVVSAIGAPFAAILSPITALGTAIGERLRPKADSAKQISEKASADAKAKQAEIQAKAKADKAKKESDLAGKKAAESSKTQGAAKAAGDPVAAQGKAKQAAIAAEAKKESDKLSHKVCAELDASAGGCVSEYLPEPAGKGSSSSISGTVTGEVTIPIPETPISAKLGQGSKVEVSRTGPKSYTVSITGDAMIYANVGVGKASSVDVKVDLPGGGKGNASKVWEKLGGGGAKPQAPAASGAEGKADVDMGYRAQSALVYGFTAGETNCKGLGGLVTLLGVLGIKGGAGFLGELAMLGAQESFESNLQSRSLTIAQGVVMSGEVKNQFAKAGIKVSGEAGLTVGQERDESGKMVDTMEVFVGGSADVQGEFEHDIISGIGGGAGVAAKASAVLGYVNDPATGTEEIKVVKLKGQASATASVAACDLNQIEKVVGSGGLAKIRAALKIDKTELNPTMASLTGQASGEVDAGVARAALADLLSDPEAASVEAIASRARQVLRDKRTKGGASLTMTLTERLAGANVEAEEREPGMNAGAKAAASIDRTETRLIWSA